MPHRRIIAYWAKGSLFANPIARWILSSAGVIPVDRKANSSTVTSASNGIDTASLGKGTDANTALFASTVRALAHFGGGAAGIFPEGTSYTEPRIVQVREGVARAALEFVAWAQRETKLEGADPVCVELMLPRMRDKLAVVPVGIVYTDKARYRSWVRVRRLVAMLAVR